MRAVCVSVRRVAKEDTRGYWTDPYPLAALPAGRSFCRPDPLRSCFGALEKRQLAARTIVLMLQLLELRLEVGLLLFVQRRTFLTGELHPIATVLGSLDPFLQGLAQLFRPHRKERLQGLPAALNLFLFRHDPANICTQHDMPPYVSKN